MMHLPAGWILWDPAAGDLSGQIYRGLRARILSGDLRSGAALPSSRSVAIALGVARATVVVAYDRLSAEGFVESRAGARTRVARLPSAPTPLVDSRALSEATGGSRRGEFAPGLPDLNAFPHVAWAQCLGARARSLRLHDLSYEAGWGLRELREAVLAHVAMQRGVLAEPDQVMILPSTTAAVSLLARLRQRERRRIAWVEEPGYAPARAALEDADTLVVPLPVDADGADVSRMHGPAPGVIYTTPSHQYPTGVTMTLPRRLALLDRAHRVDALVIEDDYDSEFLSGPSIAALQSIDRTGVVTYLGTFSKVLAPGLRTAYAIVPRALAEEARAAIVRAGLAVPIHIQAALADFIREGRLRAHVRRMAPLYRANAHRLAETLERLCGSFLAVGAARGGLQIAAWFRDVQVDDMAVASRLAVAGFSPEPLSIASPTFRRPGLLFGTARVDLKSAESVGRYLADMAMSGFGT